MSASQGQAIKQAKKILTAEQKQLRAEKRKLKRAKKRTNTRANVVQKQHGVSRPVAKAAATMPSYARVMSMPEKDAMLSWLDSVISGNAEGKHALIPRIIPAKVSPSPVKAVFSVPYQPYPATPDSDPRNGVFGLEVYRSLQCPVRAWTVEPAGVVNYAVRVNKQSQYSGFFPSNASTFDEGALNSELEVDEADILNVVGLVEHGPVLDNNGSFMRQCYNATAGSTFYGTPMDLTGTTNLTINMTAVSIGYFPDTYNFELRLISKTGVTSWVAGNVNVVGTTVHVFLTTFTIPVAALGGAFSCCLPDAPMGIQVRSLTGKGTVYLQSLNLSWGSAATSKLGWMKPYSLENIASYGWVNASSFANLRGWVEYVGSDLQNAGVISANTCPGGAPPSLLGFTGYQTTGMTLAAYTDAVKKGCWSFWKPQSLQDFDFLPRNDALPASNLTSYVIWGKLGAPVGTAGQADALKFVLSGDIEGLTRDPTRPLVECLANPLALTVACSLLYHISSCMENPLHLESIKEFLKAAAGKLKAGFEWYKDNRSWIEPALVKVGTAAGLAML